MQKLTKLEIAAYGLLFTTLAFSLIVIAPREALFQFDKLETYAALGAVIAAVEFLILRLLPKRYLKLERALYALFLGSMPFVYLSTAFFAGADLTIELVGMVIFVGLALLGYFKAFNLLALGILAHGIGWDIWHHDPAQYGYIAGWYPPACLLIDVALGILAATQISTHQAPANPAPASSNM